ncbi:MAG: glycosyltransferase family 4 protein [Anaerolineae bacterium]
MRIAMITGEYPPMRGGVGAFTHRISAAMVDQDHTVHVLTTKAPPTPEAPETDEANMIVHRAISGWSLPALARTRRWVRDIRPDVINLQYEPAAYGMKGAIGILPEALRSVTSAPLVVTFHDLLPPYLFPKAGRLRQRVVWHLAGHAHGVVVTNREDLQTLQDALEEDAPPLRMIPIGSNIAPQPPPDYDREQWRAQRGFTPEDIVVGFFGFMNPTKGIETLIAAVVQLVDKKQPVQLLFIGGRTGTSDPTNARYAERIDELISRHDLSDRVHWTGFASPPEISAAFNATDICALPYREGANLRHGTLHAALSHGCATITTSPTSPFPELQNRENVLLIPPNSASALEAAIEALAADEDLRRHIERGAATLAQRFTWPRIAEETVEFFRELYGAAARSLE